MTAKILIHSFSIKPVSINKIKKESKTTIVYKRCEAVVIKNEGIFKAMLITSPVEEQSDYRIFNFTEDSLSLKGKTVVFSKIVDKNNKNICFIRDSITATINYGTDTQYYVFREGLLIGGSIIRKNNILYFRYETLIAYSKEGTRINEPMIIIKN